jgi:hypothetical protein
MESQKTDLEELTELEDPEEEAKPKKASSKAKKSAAKLTNLEQIQANRKAAPKATKLPAKPGRKSSKKAAKAAAKAEKATTKAPAAKAVPEGIGVGEIAEALEIAPTILRRFLRQHPYLVGSHDPKTRYLWPSLKEAQPIIQAMKKAQAAAKANSKKA